MAADVSGAEPTAPVEPTAPAEQAAPAPTPPHPHRPRFLFVYGLLGGVLAAAIVVLIVYAGRSINPAPKWSAWHPSGGGIGAAKQIADQVGKTYRLPNGDQLVDVIAKEPSVSPASTTTIPIHYIAVRGSGGSGDKIVVVSSSNSIQYSLCGLGNACSIASGKASVARGTLVRREILELALYTFKYVGGVNNVIAFMPPPAGTQPQYVIYLQKSDVSDELKQPLDKTLSSKVPLPAAIPAREVHVVDSVTEPRVYKFGLSQAQQGDAILVLTPLPA
jgi:hypothetical protein